MGAVGLAKASEIIWYPPPNTGPWSPPEHPETQSSLPKAAAQLLASRFLCFYQRTPPSAPSCPIPQPRLRELICSTSSLNFYLKLLLFPIPAGRRGPVPLIPCLLITHLSRVFLSPPTSSILYFLQKSLQRRRSGPTRHQTPGPPGPRLELQPDGWLALVSPEGSGTPGRLISLRSPCVFLPLRAEKPPIPVPPPSGLTGTPPLPRPLCSPEPHLRDLKGVVDVKGGIMRAGSVLDHSWVLWAETWGLSWHPVPPGDLAGASSKLPVAPRAALWGPRCYPDI